MIIRAHFELHFYARFYKEKIFIKFKDEKGPGEKEKFPSRFQFRKYARPDLITFKVLVFIYKNDQNDQVQYNSGSSKNTLC